VRSIITIIAVVVNVSSMIGMIVGVLLHSGRGGGLSDMFRGGGAAALGSAAAERNLNRITIVLASVWLVVIIILGLFTRFGWAA